jgi:hypothetical protein
MSVLGDIVCIPHPMGWLPIRTHPFNIAFDSMFKKRVPLIILNYSEDSTADFSGKTKHLELTKTELCLSGGSFDAMSPAYVEAVITANHKNVFMLPSPDYSLLSHPKKETAELNDDDHSLWLLFRLWDEDNLEYYRDQADPHKISAEELVQLDLKYVAVKIVDRSSSKQDGCLSKQQILDQGLNGSRNQKMIVEVGPWGCTPRHGFPLANLLDANFLSVIHDFENNHDSDDDSHSRTARKDDPLVRFSVSNCTTSVFESKRASFESVKNDGGDIFEKLGGTVEKFWKMGEGMLSFDIVITPKSKSDLAKGPQLPSHRPQMHMEKFTEIVDNWDPERFTTWFKLVMKGAEPGKSASKKDIESCQGFAGVKWYKLVDPTIPLSKEDGEMDKEDEEEFQEQGFAEGILNSNKQKKADNFYNLLSEVTSKQE